MKYKVKPELEFEAYQYDGTDESYNILNKWSEGTVQLSEYAGLILIDNSISERIYLDEGDWIVKVGEQYNVYNKEVFEEYFVKV